MKFPMLRFCVIGAGQLGSAFTRGLLHAKCPPHNITLSNRSQEKLHSLQQELGVLTTKTNQSAVASADIVILAVKPNLLPSVCHEISEIVDMRRPLIVSLAGITPLSQITHWLGCKNLSALRVMTNTPIAIGHGTSTLFANAATSLTQKATYETVFQALGQTIWVEKEEMLDAMTAAVGCGPAYMFMILKAYEDAAIAQNIPPEQAKQIAIAIMLGAGQLAKQSGRPFPELQANVTTPNGVTANSLKNIPPKAFSSLFTTIFEDAKKRIEEVSQGSNYSVSLSAPPQSRL